MCRREVPARRRAKRTGVRAAERESGGEENTGARSTAEDPDPVGAATAECVTSWTSNGGFMPFQSTRWPSHAHESHWLGPYGIIVETASVCFSIVVCSLFGGKRAKHTHPNERRGIARASALGFVVALRKISNALRDAWKRLHLSL